MNGNSDESLHCLVHSSPSIIDSGYSEMRNKQKGSILLIILLLLAGAGLVFVGYKYVLKSNSQKTLTPAPYPLETIEPTANWKIYSDSKNGYKISYPNNWEKTEETNDAGSVIKLSFGDNYEVTIDPENKGVTLPLDAWANKMIKDYQNCTDCVGAFISLNANQNTKIANLATVAIDSGNEGGETTTYYFTYKNKIYSISTVTLNQLYGGGEYGSGEPDKTYSQILSTFKFTE